MEKYLTSVLAIFTCLCLTESFQISHIEKLQKSSCKKEYEKALHNKKDLDFTKAIGNLSCSPGPNGFIRYHCMVNEDGHNIQFCAEWIWIESGLCPQLYSLQGIINPEECKGEDCPTDKYQSHEYYNFSGCFVQESSPKSSKNSADGNGTIIAVSVTISVVVVIALVVGAFIFHYYRRRGVYQVVRIRPLSEAERCLQNGKCILLTGKKGEGVSTFIKMIRRKRFHDHKLKREDYGFHHINYTKNVFLVIGERSLSDEREWEALKNLINMNERQTRIVIDVPRLLYENLKERLHAECGDVVVGIDLSSDEWKMDEEERKDLIGQKMKEKKIDDTHLSESQMSQIVNYESEHYGFCYVCDRLFDGTKGEIIEKMRDVEKALKGIEEGNLSKAKTKSENVNKFEMDPLL